MASCPTRRRRSRHAGVVPRHERLDRYAGRGSPDVTGFYRFPAPAAERLAYGGRWTVGRAAVVAGRAARLRLHFHARHVYLVLGGTGDLDVLLDGSRSSRCASRLQPALHAALVPRDARTPARAPLHAGLAGYAFTFG